MQNENFATKCFLKLATSGKNRIIQYEQNAFRVLIKTNYHNFFSAIFCSVQRWSSHLTDPLYALFPIQAL